jgi:hypothetical protein
MTLFHQWILRGNIIPGYLNQSCIVNSKLYHSPPEELQIPCQYYHISFLFLGIPPFDIYFLLADFLLVTNCPVLPHGLHLRIRWAHQNLQCLSAAPPSEWWRKDAHKAQCFAPLSDCLTLLKWLSGIYKKTLPIIQLKKQAKPDSMCKISW